MTNEAAMEQVEPAAPTPAPASEPVVALIPRINVAAFCDDQGTAQAMQSAGADRRMVQAHMDVHLGGIPAAIQTYTNSKTPDVLIIESTKQRDGLLNDLGHLAHVCDPGSKVIIIGHVNDVLLYRELVSQGISEYIVAPVHQLQIIECLSGMFQDPDANPVGKVLAFVGAKGGVGSSTIAHNVGWMFSKHYATDTVITDLDMAFGTAGLNFNHEGGQGIAEALGSMDRVDQTMLNRLLTKYSDRLSLLVAPGSIDREVEVEAEALSSVLNVVRANVPSVIVDVPNLWTTWAKSVLVQADEVIITATPELACLRNAKNLVDMLKAERPNDNPPRLVMNQVGIPKRPEIPVAEFSKALGIEPVVVIPFDPLTFGTASSNGQMIEEVAVKSESAQALVALSQILQGQEPPPKQKGLALGSLKEKLATLRKK